MSGETKAVTTTTVKQEEEHTTGGQRPIWEHVTMDRSTGRSQLTDFQRTVREAARRYLVEQISDSLLRDVQYTTKHLPRDMLTRDALCMMLQMVFNDNAVSFQNVLGISDCLPWKRLIALVLMRRWIPIEELGCRLAFLPLFADLPEYKDWLAHKIATTPHLQDPRQPARTFNERTVIQWAYNKNNCAVLDWCWNVGFGSPRQRWFGPAFWKAHVLDEEDHNQANHLTNQWWSDHVEVVVVADDDMCVIVE